MGSSDIAEPERELFSCCIPIPLPQSRVSFRSPKTAMILDQWGNKCNSALSQTSGEVVTSNFLAYRIPWMTPDPSLAAKARWRYTASWSLSSSPYVSSLVASSLASCLPESTSSSPPISPSRRTRRRTRRRRRPSSGRLSNSLPLPRRMRSHPETTETAVTGATRWVRRNRGYGALL